MRHDKVVIPNSFGSLYEALKWCKAECKERNLEVKVSYYLPVKMQIYAYCKKLGISHLDVFVKVRR